MTVAEFMSCTLVIYVEPLLCLIGFILNVSCLVVFFNVWSRGYFRKASLLFYLITFTICNALQLLLSVFVIVLPAVEQFIDDEQFFEEVEALRRLNAKTIRFCYPLLMAANYASIWTLCLICCLRYQSACHPCDSWKHRLAFLRNSKICIFIVVFFAITLNVIRYWELEMNGNGNIKVAPMRNNFWYKIIQEGIVYGCIVYGFPAIILLCFNINTLKLIKLDQRNRCRLLSENRTASMTVFVFIIFVICTTMAASIRLVMMLTENLFILKEYIWLVDLSNLLMNINALIMPIVCFVFTRGFRDLFFIIRYAPSDPEELVACSMKCNKRAMNANLSKVRFNTETLYRF